MEGLCNLFLVFLVLSWSFPHLVVQVRTVEPFVLVFWGPHAVGCLNIFACYSSYLGSHEAGNSGAEQEKGRRKLLGSSLFFLTEVR